MSLATNPTPPSLATLPDNTVADNTLAVWLCTEDQARREDVALIMVAAKNPAEAKLKTEEGLSARQTVRSLMDLQPEWHRQRWEPKTVYENWHKSATRTMRDTIDEYKKKTRAGRSTSDDGGRGF